MALAGVHVAVGAAHRVGPSPLLLLLRAVERALLRAGEVQACSGVGLLHPGGAGGLPQVAGARVGDAVVAAHRVRLRVRHLRAGHPGAAGLLGLAQGEVHRGDALVPGQREAEKKLRHKIHTVCVP